LDKVREPEENREIVPLIKTTMMKKVIFLAFPGGSVKAEEEDVVIANPVADSAWVWAEADLKIEVNRFYSKYAF
jgi:hypothetical protein